jgi:tetratricopeptide (TPR) repeat protein
MGVQNKLRMILVGATVAATGAAAAQDIVSGDEAKARKYAGCMQLARARPEEAHGMARTWLVQGGGHAATHCLSVALLGMGQYDQAARNMEALAAALKGGSAALQGDLLGQAGNAWMIAGKPGLAFAAQSRALALKPDDLGLLIDRGITLASTGKYWEALDDLNRAIELDPGRAEALVFRAAAYRNLDSLELAADDIARALDLRPDNLDALLERGEIRHRKKNNAGARADWMRVLELAAEGPVAEAARQYLEKMDVKKR